MEDYSSILIVEDDNMTAELYVQLLKRAGYDVYHSLDTEGAEGILADTRIDLLLIDYDLPDHIGLHWLRELREHDAFATTPAILISYLPRFDDLTGDENIWFMQKPKLPQQIVTAVESTIAQFRK